jgi:PKD repeat protein
MNRKLLISAALFSQLAGMVNAQVIYSETFSNQALPGWSIVTPSGPVMWKWSNTAASTGSSPGTFDHAGAANGHVIVDSDGDSDETTKEYSTLTSGPINCSGKATVILSFYEFYARFQNDTPRVFISSDSVNWTMVHNPALGLAANQSTANPSLVEVNVTAQAANQATVYIRFSWKGTYDYWWFVDDVTLFVPSSNEAEVTAVDNLLTNGCNLSNAEPISITFRNKGLSPISTLTAYYSINGGTPVSETATLGTPINFTESATYNFTQTANFTTADIYSITGWVLLAGDTINENDTAFSAAISVDPLSIATPQTQSFEVPPVGNEISGLTWTTLDANNDGATWFISGANANTGDLHYRYLWNDDAVTAANDWLFSPCLTLSSTKAYKVTFFDEVGEDGTVFEEKLRLKAGTTKSAAGMTEDIFDFGTQSNITYEERKAAFKPAGSGTYYIGFQCYSDADKWFLNVDDITIEELAKPVAAFSTTGSGSNITVNDASEDLVTTWTWNWGDGSSNSTGMAPGPHTYTAPGAYEICLIVTNLAGADTLCKTITIVGINEADASAHIGVYPNPTHGVVQVSLSDEVKNDARLEIVNVIGETVITRTTSGSSVEKFDLSNLPSGVYSVKVNSGTLVAVKKFVYSR